MRLISDRFIINELLYHLLAIFHVLIYCLPYNWQFYFTFSPPDNLSRFKVLAEIKASVLLFHFFYRDYWILNLNSYFYSWLYSFILFYILSSFHPFIFVLILFYILLYPFILSSFHFCPYHPIIIAFHGPRYLGIDWRPIWRWDLRSGLYKYSNPYCYH